MAYYFLNAQTETIKKLKLEIESLQVERNFFRDKYESQMEKILLLEKELKRSNTLNIRLRKQLIQNVTPVKSNSKSRVGSSLDKIESSLEKIEKSFDDDVDELDTMLENSSGRDESNSDFSNDYDSKKKSRSQDTDSETISSYGTNDNVSDIEDEIDIRDHAEKMLIWADISCGNENLGSNHSSLSKSNDSNNEESEETLTGNVKDTNEASTCEKQEDDVRDRAAKLLMMANYSEKLSESVCLDN